MKYIIAFLLIVFITGTNLEGKNEEFTVAEFYKKIELDDGTLDEDGNSIEFIFVKTKLEQGKYEIEITDGPGDLYEIKRTDIFMKFRGYYGYAGYGEDGILIVNSGYLSSVFYKIE